MITLMSEKYLTDKEAADRYGYSTAWFIKARVQGYGPHYIQIKPRGRVLYPLDETDRWFTEKMKEKE